MTAEALERPTLDPGGRRLETDECAVVAVYSYRPGKARALCSCGWRGHFRHFKSMAVLDALLHAGQSGCEPAAPLVLDARFTQAARRIPAQCRQGHGS